MLKHLICAVLFLVMPGCAFDAPHFDEEQWRIKVESTDAALLFAPHLDENGIFFNPWLERERTSRGILGPLRYQLAPMEDMGSFPEADYAMLENDFAYLSDPAQESITFTGHASFIIKMDGQTIMTDPFFSGWALVKPTVYDNEPDWGKIQENPVVLISHNHYDHLDEYSVKQLIRKNAIFLVPLGLAGFFIDLGADSGRVHELDWWESVSINGIAYTFVPAQHWSRHLWQDAGSTLWGGYVMQGGKTIYFSGDTGYFKGFRAIGERFPGLDYALLGAGAYEPRWMMHYAHQNVEEFFRSVDDLGAKIAIPMHLGIIELGKEPVLYPLHEVDMYLKNNPRYEGRVAPLRVNGMIMME